MDYVLKQSITLIYKIRVISSYMVDTTNIASYVKNSTRIARGVKLTRMETLL